MIDQFGSHLRYYLREYLKPRCERDLRTGGLRSYSEIGNPGDHEKEDGHGTDGASR